MTLETFLLFFPLLSAALGVGGGGSSAFLTFSVI